MGIQSEEELNKAYKFLEEGNPSKAKRIIADAIEFDLENQELNFAYWCCSFWDEFIKNLPQQDAMEQGENLIARWEAFSETLERGKQIIPRAVFAVQHGVFTLALNAFSKMQTQLDRQESNMKNMLARAEIYRKEGLCCKKIGQYEEALSFLMQANSYSPSSAPVLAEMADCFALCGEEKKAKVLFREAFFIDAQKIAISFLESELIRRLIEQVKLKGYSGAALLEWIPVYGVLYGIFNIKRELRPQEANRLKQDVYALENELKDPKNDPNILKPKIINMYFWLIDYYSRACVNIGYEAEATNRQNIDECLLQIRVHDENIYDMYIR